MNNLIQMARRQAERAQAAVRQAFRGVLAGLDVERPVQLARRVDGLSGEKVPSVELFQHYGFTSSPPDGTQAIVLPLGGRTPQSVVIATEPAAGRFQLDARGESAMYCVPGGSVIHLQANGTVLIETAGTVTVTAASVVIDADDVHITGNLRVNGDITDNVSGGGSSMQSMRAVYNSHIHPEHDSGGPTGAPLEGM